ncbi:hypothetical protein ABZY58_11540 [Micromonospora tulbaghiae]|uniref:hypothetical protein n=1 Tax=Micromonospora tulbaghiae TaxID=479978 RepID=UPI0033A99021
MRIRIRTSDSAWADENGTPATDGETWVPVPADVVESLTFAGQPMLRFDLREVDGSLPRDWPDPWAQVPAGKAEEVDPAGCDHPDIRTRDGMNWFCPTCDFPVNHDAWARDVDRRDN